MHVIFCIRKTTPFEFLFMLFALQVLDLPIKSLDFFLYIGILVVDIEHYLLLRTEFTYFLSLLQ